MSKSKISWNFYRSSKFCSIICLFSTYDCIFPFWNMKFKLFYPLKYIQVWGLCMIQNSENFSCLKVILAFHFCIITSVGLNGDDTDMTVWTGSPELSSLTVLKFMQFLADWEIKSWWQCSKIVLLLQCWWGNVVETCSYLMPTFLCFLECLPLLCE